MGVQAVKLNLVNSTKVYGLGCFVQPLLLMEHQQATGWSNQVPEQKRSGSLQVLSTFNSGRADELQKSAAPRRRLPPQQSEPSEVVAPTHIAL